MHVDIRPPPLDPSFYEPAHRRLARSHSGSSLKRRNILQIIPSMEIGGEEQMTLDLVSALSETGARPLVATSGGKFVKDIQVRGGIYVPFPAHSKNPFSMLLNIRKLARLIHKERIDVVHAHSRASAWVALGASRLTRTPFVTTYHGIYSGHSPLKALYNSVMARGDAVIANSLYAASIISQFYPFASQNLRVIYRGTDFQLYSPDQVDYQRVLRMRQLWGIRADERIILVPAKLTSSKGHRIAIEALRNLKAQGMSDLKLIFVGDQHARRGYITDLQRLIRTSDLAQDILFVGPCPDMPAALMTASVVVIPSIKPEAFGRAAIQAQAMGAPLIVTQIGASPETVLTPPQVPLGAQTGWCIPPNDIRALTDALLQVFKLGATARESLAQRARAHVLSHFSIERMCHEMLDIYSALCETRKK